MRALVQSTLQRVTLLGERRRLVQLLRQQRLGRLPRLVQLAVGRGAQGVELSGHLAPHRLHGALSRCLDAGMLSDPLGLEPVERGGVLGLDGGVLGLSCARAAVPLLGVSGRREAQLLPPPRFGLLEGGEVGGFDGVRLGPGPGLRRLQSALVGPGRLEELFAESLIGGLREAPDPLLNHGDGFQMTSLGDLELPLGLGRHRGEPLLGAEQLVFLLHQVRGQIGSPTLGGRGLFCGPGLPGARRVQLLVCAGQQLPRRGLRLLQPVEERRLLGLESLDESVQGG